MPNRLPKSSATSSGKPYVPDRGELVWLDLDPQAGHEQSGRRPAIVLSRKAYNAKSGLALFCPITNQVKGYPFEVPVPAESGATGVVIADQVRSLDWRARRAVRMGRVSDEVTETIVARIGALLD